MNKIFILLIVNFMACLCLAQPSNNNCSNAQALTIGSISNCTNTLGTNVNATASGETPLPSCGNFNSGEDVWFSVTVPSSGNIAIEVSDAGGPDDWAMSVYSGSCGSLVEIDCDDDDGLGLFPKIELTDQTTNDILLVRVWEFGNNEQGIFNICVSEIPPANSDCSNAEALIMGAIGSCTNASGTNLNASASGQTPIPTCGGFLTGEDVWYSVTVPSSGNITIEMSDAGGPDDWAMSVYSGICGNLVEVECDDDDGPGAFPKIDLTGQTENDVLLVRVWVFASNAEGNFNICAFEIPPENNDCLSPQILPVGAISSCTNTLGTNVNATASGETPVPSCGSFITGEDVWFSVTVPSSGNLTIEMSDAGGPNDWTMSVYSGSCGSLVEIECDDDDGLGFFPKIELTGQTANSGILVRVLEYGNNEVGSFNICAFETPPVNDNCADAQVLTVGAGDCLQILGTNINASTSGEIPIPICGPFVTGEDVWFSITVPTSGNLTIEMSDAGGPNFWVMAIYSGTCGSLTEINCVNTNVAGHYPQVALTGQTANNVLLVRVFTFAQYAEGNFNICAYDPMPPLNDNCANAEPLTLGAGNCNDVLGDNRDATASGELPLPTCANIGTGEDIWYSVIVPNSGIITIEVADVGGWDDWVMSVYSGTCGNLVEVECEINYGSGGFSKIELIDQTGNEVLLVRVFERNNNEEGNFSICAYSPMPPTNDNCAEAQILPVGAGDCLSTLGTNISVSASGELPLPTCGYFGNGEDVWYSVMVPTSGNITLEVKYGGGPWNLEMSVYSGTCGNLVEIICENAPGALPMIELTGQTANDILLVRLFKGDSGAEGNFNICAYDPMPPLNDNCLNAQALVIGSGVCIDEFGDNRDATASGEMPNPSCGSFGTGEDVWYSVMVPSSGNIAIKMDYAGTPSDFTMSVYTGTCGALTEIECSDDYGYGLYPIIELSGQTPNDTLLVRIFEDGNNNIGDFYICAYEFTPIANNVCSSAEVLVVGAIDDCISVMGSNINATASGESPIPSCGNFGYGDDVWYSMTVPTSGNITIELDAGTPTTGGTPNWVMSVYSGTCGALVELNCDDDSGPADFPTLQLTDQTANDILLVRIFESNTDAVGYFNICAYEFIPPGNNDCSSAEALTVGAIGICANTLGTNYNSTASGETPIPSCGNFGSGEDVWYSVTVPTSGNIIIEVSDAVGSMLWGMSVYSGSCGGLVEIECDVGITNSTPKIQLWGQTPNDVLMVRVYDENNDGERDFNICAYEFMSPANDNCLNAQMLPIGAGNCLPTLGTNVNGSSSGELPIPSCGNFGFGEDVWYSVTVPASGNITIEMSDAGGPIDWLMSVYSNSCGSLVELECDDDDGPGRFPKIELTSQTSNDILLIRVLEFNNDQEGNFNICAYDPMPPLNDTCINAQVLTVGLAVCNSVLGDNRDATASGELSIPTCGSFATGKDVWYSVSVPSSGNIAIELTDAGGPNDWAMSVYSGSCGSLVEIECDDNDGSGSFPKLLLSSQIANDILLVRVWDYGNDEEGNFNICAYDFVPVANNDCSSAEALTVGAIGTCTNTIGTNINATVSGESPAPTCTYFNYGDDVWFSAIVPASGNITIEMSDAGGPVDWLMSVYSGTCGSLIEEECNGYYGNFPLIELSSQTANEVLLIRVFDNNNNDVEGNFNICAYEFDAVANNDCSSAEVLAVGPIGACENTLGTNINSTASGELPVPSCGYFAGDDVWYSVIVPANGNITIEMSAGGLNDWAMSVYSGTCGSLIELGCDDPNIQGVFPRIELSGQTANDILLVRIYCNNNGSFNICAYEFVPVVNNDCSSAEDLTVGAIGVCTNTLGTNVNCTASGETPVPSCGNFGNGDDVWYSAMAPASGNITIEISDAGGPDYWKMSVYSGACGSLVELGCVYKNGFSTIIQLTGQMVNSELLVRVWEHGNNQEGNFNICAYDFVPVDNNDCSNAQALIVGGIDSCTNTLGTNVFATASGETPYPFCGSFGSGEDVWYSVVVPSSGNIAIEGSDAGGLSNFNMVAYSGACGSLVNQGCAQYFGFGARILLTGQIANDVLLVRVYDNNNDEQDIFNICAYEFVPIANNNCTSAEVLTVGAYGVCANTLGTSFNFTASGEIPLPSCGYSEDDVWYAVTVPTSGNINIEMSYAGDLKTWKMSVYSGICGSLVEIGCEYDFGIFPEIELTGQTANEVLLVRITANFEANFNICAYDPIIPVNDNCINAKALAIGSGGCNGELGNNRDATASGELPSPSCGIFGTGEDVWYSVIVPSSGNITIEISDAGGPTNWVMSVYSGTCGSLVEIECDKAIYSGFFPKIELTGQTANEVLLVRVFDNNNDVEGSFNICAYDPIPPLNDDCANAQALTIGSGVCIGELGDNIDATASGETPVPSCGYLSGEDIWYSVSVPNSGNITIEMSDAGGPSTWFMSVYSGSCGGLVEVACDDPNVYGVYPKIELTGHTANEELLVRVFEFGSMLEGNFNICAYDPMPPLNNICANAQSLIIGSGICIGELGDNKSATPSGETPVPSCGNFGDGEDVWYSVIVPTSGNINIEVNDAGGPNNWTMSVYSGSCGSLVEIECDNYDGIGLNPKIELTGQIANSGLLVRVWEHGNDIEGYFNICAYDPLPPLNDNCANPQVLIVSAACNPTLGDNIDATASGELPTPSCGYSGTGDVWYSVTVPSSGKIIIEMSGAGGPNGCVMSVYSGACGGLVEVVCDDPSFYGVFPKIELTGQTVNDILLVRVFNFYNDVEGIFNICAYDPIPPLNDNCANAQALTIGSGACNGELGDNIDATASGELPVPLCGTFGTGEDVWYSVIVPNSGKITIEVSDAGGPRDWVVSVYSGMCGSLVEVDCNDDDGPDNFPKIELIGQTANDTLLVRVFEFSNNENGNFYICAYDPACPTNLTLSGNNGGDNSDADNITNNETDGVIQSTQVIQFGAMIGYDSGTEINLNPGFEVFQGAIFNAFIDGCNAGGGGNN